MPTYANLCPDTPIASIDISDIDIRYTRYVWRDWQFPHLWQCLHPDQCFNSTHYSTKTKLKSKLRVLFGTYRRSQCLFLQVYIDQVSLQFVYSKTASLVSIRNLHIGKNAFTKLCSCWTKKDPLLMRHPPLGFFIALHYWEPLCACLLNRLNLLGLKCSGPWPLNPRLAAKLALALLLQHSNTTSPQESCKRSSQAMPTYANLCPDTPIASIDISDIDIRYTRYVWRDWQFPHLWQCLHPDQCFNSTHYSTKTKLKSKLRVLFGTYRRSQCLFLQVYIDQVSLQFVYSKTASLVSIRNLHSGKNAFTKLCSCWLASWGIQVQDIARLLNWVLVNGLRKSFARAQRCSFAWTPLWNQSLGRSPCCNCSALNPQTSSHFHGLQDRQMHGGNFSCRMSPPKPYPVAIIIAPVANPASPQRQIIHLSQGFAQERFCWAWQMNQTVE